MTSHVAQFFLTDAEWAATLADLHRALVPGGRLVLRRARSRRPRRGSAGRRSGTARSRSRAAATVEQSIEVTDIAGDTVTHTIHYRFADDDELESAATLRFRTEDELRTSLAAAGFTVERDLRRLAANRWAGTASSSSPAGRAANHGRADRDRGSDRPAQPVDGARMKIDLSRGGSGRYSRPHVPDRRPPRSHHVGVRLSRVRTPRPPQMRRVFRVRTEDRSGPLPWSTHETDRSPSADPQPRDGRHRSHVRPSRRRDPAGLRPADRLVDPPHPRAPRAGRRPHGRGLRPRHRSSRAWRW